LAKAACGLTDAQYLALIPSRSVSSLIKLAPSWYRPVRYLAVIWGWGELLVLLTNRKKRALHDFLAGTVVVYVNNPPVKTPEPRPSSLETYEY